MLVSSQVRQHGTQVYNTVRALEKRPGQALNVTRASAAPRRSSSVFFLTDRNSGLRFLVDMGAEVSVVTASPADHKRLNASLLEAVNDTTGTEYGNPLTNGHL